MRYTLSFHEALQDSPRFRRDLLFAENDIQSFEHKLEKLIYCNRTFQDTAKNFLSSFESLVTLFTDLSEYFTKDNDDPVKETLKETVDYLRQVKSLNENLLDCVNRSVFKHGTYFITSEIKPLHDNKKSFDKLSDDLDVALVKNSQIGRSKVSETEEGAKVIKALRSYFAHAVLDYVFHVNKFAQSKRLTTINLVLALLRGHKSYFEQGSQLSAKTDIDQCLTLKSFIPTQSDPVPNGIPAPIPKQKSTDLNLEGMELLANDTQRDLLELTKDMEERHCLVKERERSLNSLKGLQDCIALQRASNKQNRTSRDEVAATMEGYLFKRSTGKFKTWNRRWFAIRRNQLVYCKRKDFSQGGAADLTYATGGSETLIRPDQSSGSDSPAPVRFGKPIGPISVGSRSGPDRDRALGFKVMEKDLRLCSVKHVTEIDRRHCFEVISPLRCHLLQADSEVLCQAWVNALQAGISSAYNDDNFDGRSPERVAEEGSSGGAYHKIFLNNDSPTSLQGMGKWPENADDTVKLDRPNFDTNTLSDDVTATDLNAVSATGARCTNGTIVGPADASLNTGLLLDLLPTRPPNPKLSPNFGERASLKVPVVTRTCGLSPTPSVKGDKHLSIRDILAVPGNAVCCDCSCPKPEWASINLGITLCIECSGIHRSLGVHRSKVRSLYLDAWESEHIKIMLALGNDNVNQIYLGNAPSSLPAPTDTPQNRESNDPKQKVFGSHISVDSTREEREAYTKLKYVEKAWVRNLDTTVIMAAPLKTSSTPTTHDDTAGNDTFPTVRNRISYFENDSTSRDNTGVPRPLYPETAVTPKTFVSQLWSISPPSSTALKEDVNSQINTHASVERQMAVLMLNGLLEPGRLVLKNVAWAMALGQGPDSALDVFDTLPGDGSQGYQVKFDHTPSHQTTTEFQQGHVRHWSRERLETVHLDPGMTPLQIAATCGNSTTIEYLLLNGAKADVKNVINGYTALHYATLQGRTRVVCQLIKRGADIGAITHEGKDALDLAISQENADIVTLLRVGKLRLETDNLASDDMTFTEVMNDFSKMTHAQSQYQHR